MPRVAAIFGVLAALICFSRVYVGVHYVSDVLGGAVIGTLTGHALAQLYRDDSWYARRATRLF